MYRVDIFTDLGVYVAIMDRNMSPGLDLCEFITSGGEKTANAILEHAAYLVHKGVRDEFPLFGWTPLDNINTAPPAAFIICKGSEVKHIRAYRYEEGAVDQEGPAAEPLALNPAATPVGPSAATYQGEYLGNDITIKLIEWASKSGYVYVMPVSVNGVPAITMLNPAALVQQVQLIKADTPATDYEIVVPEVPMSDEEAVEYLRDYADEPPTRVDGAGKAKAWHDWANEGKV